MNMLYSLIDYTIQLTDELLIIINAMTKLMSKECSLYLLSNNSMSLSKYNTLSGLGFNKLGLYSECIQDENNQFYLLKGYSDYCKQTNSPQNYFISGICFNKVCSDQDLNYVLTALQTYVKVPFKLVDVVTPSSISPTFDTATLAICLVLSLLSFILVLSSIVDWFAKKKKLKGSLRIIEIFSIFTTFEMLSSKGEKRTDRLKIFSGLKVIALMGILIAHFSTIGYNSPSTTMRYNSPGYYFITFFFFDVWLMISGFFLSYLLLKQYLKLKSYYILLLKMLRRFLRLWPLYLVSLFFNWKLLPYFGKGPLWPLIINYPERFCETNYLDYIFMISNLWPRKCYNWLWLFEVDIQLCLLMTPFLLVYLKFATSRGRILFFLLQISLVIGSMLFSILQPKSDITLSEYMNRQIFIGVSIFPMTHLSAYLVGFNLGIIFYQFRRTDVKTQFWVLRCLQNHILRNYLVITALGALISLSCLLNHLSSQKSLEPEWFYLLASFHFIIPLLFALIILPSLFGYNSPLKHFLESAMMNFLSKLSLSFYAVHYSIELTIVYSRKSDMEFLIKNILFFTICSILPALLISIAITALIEIPVFLCKQKYWKNHRITYFEH